MGRSTRWVAPQNVAGLLHRADLRACGLQAVSEGKPLIGICNSWSELVHCNMHLRSLAQFVKRGIIEAGGVPVEFPTISLSENLMKPTAMLYRNLMSMDVEESLRAHPLDGVVLLGSCDKTIPAQIMGAISADIPAIVLPGGPSEPGYFKGRELGVGTDLWHYTDDFRAGRMSAEEYGELESALMPSYGHCNEMGTASTMGALCEALGIALIGTATIPAVHIERKAAAVRCGAAAVELAISDTRPREIITAGAIDNAISVLAALGGSTNAIIHLLAFAGRLGIELGLERFAELSSRTPKIVNVRPSGDFLTKDLHRAGGIGAVMAEISDRLHLDVKTVSGRTLGEEIAGASSRDDAVIAKANAGLASGSITVLDGNIAPNGAVLKRSAASPDLLRHRGPAVVFDGVEDVLARFDDPDLDVEPDSVLILRGIGPVGAPGMPEWGMLPIPSRLLKEGVTDMVRVSDGRMSGTAFGTVVLHVAPEAAVGGPLSLVRDGDPVILDADLGKLHLDIEDRELERRRQAAGRPSLGRARGYIGLYLEHVLQADLGCDFDFLLPDGESADSLPGGLFDGWLSGW